MRDDLLTRIGERVRALRVAQDISQAILGERVELGRSSIANLEAGRQNVPIATLVAIAAELSTSVGALVGETPLPELPAVRIKTVHTVTCARCGQLGGPTTEEHAQVQRRNHISAHLTGAIEREVTA